MVEFQYKVTLDGGTVHLLLALALMAAIASIALGGWLWWRRAHRKP